MDHGSGRFPVGYRSFHPDPAICFELNRWLGPLPEEELWQAAPRIGSLADWKTVMLELGERAESAGRTRAAAFYYRAAEFFLDVADPDKDCAYRRFIELFDRSVADVPHRRERVPYQGARLPAIVLPSRGDQHASPVSAGRQVSAAHPRDKAPSELPSGRGQAARTGGDEPEAVARAKATVLLHGGFDSMMEELFDWALFLAEGGYDVILFEGPGQGAALRDHGLVMRPEWERPVAAVLDHFGIERATLFGISLGGYLAPRAAAFEPRIERVVVCDVLDDFFDCFAARAGEAVAGLLARLVAAGARADVNALLERTMGESPSTAWAIRHGMHTSGAADPFEFLAWLGEMRTAPFSDRITQDVLLLAGAEDHIVPPHQLWRQARNLPHARSLTTRLFTAAEQASNHCQIGNVGLALGFVRSWLDLQTEPAR